MNEVKIIQHKDVNTHDLMQICEIKNINWPHSVESQMKWIQTHIRGLDYHLLVYQSGQLIAYCSVVHISAIINSKELPVLGVGNVCTRTKGLGYGNVVMNEVNKFIQATGSIAILLCKEALVPYYKKYHWQMIEKVSGPPSQVLVFNPPMDISELKYSGKNF